MIEFTPTATVLSGIAVIVGLFAIGHDFTGSRFSPLMSMVMFVWGLLAWIGVLPR
jgi:hypothetical protein